MIASAGAYLPAPTPSAGAQITGHAVDAGIQSGIARRGSGGPFMVRVCAVRTQNPGTCGEGAAALTLWVHSPVGCLWSELGGFGAAQGDGDGN